MPVVAVEFKSFTASHKVGSTVIVGIVADIRHRTLDEKPWPELFLPFEQVPSPWLTVLVRSTSEPAALGRRIREAAQSIDSTQPLFDIELLERKMSASLADRRERAFLLGAFAALALLIAAVGIYGTMSYAVARRTHEIGLRMALGAGQKDVLLMIVKTGLHICAVGMVIGVATALFLTRTLRKFLYGIEPTDITTFVLACSILGAVVCLASYLPARRAALLDPIKALHGG